MKHKHGLDRGEPGTTGWVPNGGQVKREKSMMQEASPHILQKASREGGGGWTEAGNILLPDRVAKGVVVSQAGPEASRGMLDNYRSVSGQGMEYMTPSRSPSLYQSRLWQGKENSGGRHIIICVACFFYLLRNLLRKILCSRPEWIWEFHYHPPYPVLLFKRITKAPTSWDPQDRGFTVNKNRI